MTLERNSHIKNTNLERPELNPDLLVADNVAVGDMHGNVTNLLAFLVEYGVIAIPETAEIQGKTLNAAQFMDLFTQLYDEDCNTITAEQLDAFDQLIKQLICLDPKKFFILIGDIVADRGSNDYFTLMLFMRMLLAALKFDISISNHDLEFIICIELALSFSRRPTYLNSPHNAYFVRSMYNLEALIQRELVKREKIIKMYHEAYLPHLRAMSYIISEDKKHVDLFSHAPGGTAIDNILLFCYKLTGIYNVKNLTELMALVDVANHHFQLLAKSHQINNLFDDLHNNNPFFEFAMQRSYQEKLFVDKESIESVADLYLPEDPVLADIKEIAISLAKETEMTVRHIHGHGREEYETITIPNVIDLDAKLGRHALDLSLEPEGDRVLYVSSQQKLEVAEVVTLDSDQYAYISHNPKLHRLCCDQDVIFAAKEQISKLREHALSFAREDPRLDEMMAMYKQYIEKIDDYEPTLKKFALVCDDEKLAIKNKKDLFHAMDTIMAEYKAMISDFNDVYDFVNQNSEYAQAKESFDEILNESLKAYSFTYLATITYELRELMRVI